MTNQRIEALWSRLRPHIEHWRSFFYELINTGDFEPGNDTLITAARFSFSSLIQKTLDDFINYWNCHRIRQSSECPGGKPDELFFLMPSECLSITEQQLDSVNNRLTHSVTVTGDEDIDNYYKYVWRERGYEQASSCKADALILYRNLVEAANGST